MAEPHAVPSPAHVPHRAIWASEAAFFDAIAPDVAAASRPLDPAVLARYRDPLRLWFNKEYRFLRLGDPAGQEILDVGCGTGENAILLAALGARVTGIDVSPRSIEAARRRAEATAPRVPPRFVCAPLETADLPEGAFDVVWGDGVLHHVLHDLEGVLARLVRVARPGALFLFSEPVDRVPLLRRVRLALPIRVDGTEHERPLVEAELDVVRRFLPDLRTRAFSVAGRLNRFVLPGGDYEHAPLARRVLANALCAADFAALSLPGVDRLGGMLVMWGHAAAPSP